MSANKSMEENRLCYCGEPKLKESVFCKKCYDARVKKNDKLMDVKKLLRKGGMKYD